MAVTIYSILSLLCVVLWIWALVSCIQSDNPNKLVWILVIIFLPLLGSILYFVIGNNKRGTPA